MAGRLEFGFNLRTAGKPGARRVDPDAPMRLLLIGDFSGRGELGTGDAASLDRRPILRVDIDTFDQVLARLKPSVRLAVPGAPLVETSMSALDDFHPDRLLRQLELFRSLRKLRARLQDPSRFAEAAATFDLERLLGRSPGDGEAAAARAATGASDVDAFVRALIAPYVVADTTSPQRAQATAAIDTAMGEHLRSVLHAPAFQTLEAHWRGLRWLLDNLELDDNLQVHLLDITRAELLADAQAMHADPQSSALRRRLAEESAAGGDAKRWSACVALFDVGASEEDLTWLSALGAIGAQAGAPTLATASPSLLGVDRIENLAADSHDWPAVSGTAAAYWQALRRSQIAPWIGLAAPRLLMRQPYGATTDPIEGIPFEELSGTPEHAHLLWAPAALGCALLLGLAFRENGWEMHPGDVQQITDLPAYIVERDGERQLQPCAEVLMSERAALAIGERGIMAVASYKDRAEARLVRFQSVAEPACALSGPWS
jgi:type VI secretion system protein ImpC